MVMCPEDRNKTQTHATSARIFGLRFWSTYPADL
jgi:hypothetical protein